MSDEQDLTAITLDAERRREIDAIKQRFEDWAHNQQELNIELKHEMEMVVQGQNALKERFEEGVSKTLFSLNKKFDDFMVQWGEKKKEDEFRDREITNLNTGVERFNEKIRWLAFVAVGGGLVVLVFEVIKRLNG